MNDYISVIMSCYNEKIKWISESIDSILNQTHKELELIIVLDNPENTEIYKLLKEKEDRDKRIRIFKNDKNIGLANSLNFAISKCKYKYIARMDADDIALPKRLEVQMKYLIENNADIVGANCILIDEFDNIIGQSNYPISSKQINSLLNYTNCLAHPTWLLRSDLYKVANGYYSYNSAQDYDFLLRIKNKGFKIMNTPEVLLNYRKRASSIGSEKSLDQFQTAEYIRKMNRSKVYDVHCVKNFNNTKEDNFKFNKIIKFPLGIKLTSLRMFYEVTMIFKHKLGLRYFMYLYKSRICRWRIGGYK
ncbi:glycosyltransferase [Niallia sp. FSL W8-0635]|uniref:glycosyltransferase n=1 Tax=Niallia sp. FSL W8-0635 TaxID=2975337 RepID=UPI0030FAE3C8